MKPKATTPGDANRRWMARENRDAERERAKSAEKTRRALSKVTCAATVAADS